MSYIEKETALEFVLNNTPHINGETTMKCVERAIKAIPTADVVEVVRCRDCVHFDRKTSTCNHFGYYTYAPDVDEDDYCSYGERKEQ